MASRGFWFQELDDEGRSCTCTATLSDLCDLIENGSEHERMRFYKLVKGSSFESLIGSYTDAADYSMPMLGPEVKVFCKRCKALLTQYPPEDHECRS